MKKFNEVTFTITMVLLLLLLASCASQETQEPEVANETVEEESVEEPVKEPVEAQVEEIKISINKVNKSNVHNRGSEGLAIYDDTVVSGSWDNSIVMSSLGTGKTIKLIRKAHNSDVVDIEFETNGKFFASIGLDRSIKIWDAQNGTLIKSIKLPVNAIDLSISTGVNPYIAVAALDGMVYIFDYERGSKISQFRATTKYSTAVQFIDRNRVVAATADGLLLVFDIKNSKVVLSGKAHSQRINVLRINSDASMLASAGWDKTVKIWDIKTQSQVASLTTPEQGAIESLEFYPLDNFILAGDRSWNVIAWDIHKQEIYSVNDTNSKRVYDIRFNASGDSLVITGYDSLVRFYSIAR